MVTVPVLPPQSRSSDQSDYDECWLHSFLIRALGVQVMCVMLLFIFEFCVRIVGGA